MFPKVSRKVITDGKSRVLEISKKFLTKKLALHLDKKACTGCGVCYNVCPKEAIDRGPIGAAKRLQITNPDLDLSPEVADPNKCSFCGVCVTLCPFSALSLWEDDEEVPIPELMINKEHALPELEVEEAVTQKSKQKVKKYFDGTIKLNSEKCAGGCSTCVFVCPTGAITKAQPEEGEGGWVMSQKTVLDERDCIYCGACYSVCGSDAIEFKRTKVYIKKDTKFNEPFWPDLEQKLLNPKRQLHE